MPIAHPLVFITPQTHDVLIELAYATPNNVADPRIGSNRTRGTAVDLTLVNAQGHELDMGTGFRHIAHEWCALRAATA